jgi:hypothetical protein
MSLLYVCKLAKAYRFKIMLYSVAEDENHGNFLKLKSGRLKFCSNGP